MSTQLDVLKNAYETMETGQKKEFIAKLSKQLKGTKNAAYTQFLTECIRDYNREIHINTSITKTGQSDIQVNNFYGYDADNQKAIQSSKIHTPSLALSIIGLVFALLITYVTYGCSIPGLVMAVKNRHTHKTKPAMIMCIVGLSVAFVNSILGIILYLM